MRRSVKCLITNLACARFASFAVTLIVLVIVVTGSLPLDAQTSCTWIGGNGNWSNHHLWSSCVPNGNYNAYIDGFNQISSTVTLDVSVTVQNLNIDTNDTLSFAPGQSLTVGNTSYGTLAISGSMIMNGGGASLQLANSAVSLTNELGYSPGILTMVGDGNNTIVGLSGNNFLNNQITIQGAGNITSVNMINDSVISAIGGSLTITPANYFTNFNLVQATNGGTLIMNNFPNGATIYNAGIIQASFGNVVLSGGIINNSSGVIQAQDPFFFSEVDLQNGVVINGGTLVSGGQGLLVTNPIGLPPTLNGVTLSGTYFVNPHAAVMLQGATTNSALIIDQGNISNSGAFSNIGGTVTIYPVDSFVGVTSSTGQRTDSYRQSGTLSSTNLQGGTLSSLTGVWIDGGIISGDGTISAPWLHVDGGIVNPLVGPANQLTIQGGYMQSGGSTPGVLRIFLFSPTSYDELFVHGTAWLRGELQVELGTFTPSLGESFTIMTYNLRKGRFDTLNAPGLPLGEKWSVEYLPRSVVLTVVPDGLLPTTEFSASGDSSQLAAAAPVPEPSSICLLATALSLVGSRFRQRTRSTA